MLVLKCVLYEKVTEQFLGKNSTQTSEGGKDGFKTNYYTT